MKRKVKSLQVSQIIICVVLGLLAFTTLYPLLYTLTMSLSDTVQAVKAGFHLYPEKITLESYKMVFANPDIYTGYFNTVFRTVVGTVCALIVTAMTAYPLSKSYMPNKSLYSFLVMFTMLFSGGMVPSYILMVKLHLIDNRLAYILPLMVSAYNVIIMKSYYMSIPDSLSESAKIDGAGEFRTLFQIIIPVCKPVLATVALWDAVAHWNSWMDGLLYINDDSKQVVMIFLQRIINQNQTDMLKAGIETEDILAYSNKTIQAATIMVTIIPILLVYPYLQKFFVKGIMLGSVKG